jgi:hypothetical protein
VGGNDRLLPYYRLNSQSWELNSEPEFDRVPLALWLRSIGDGSKDRAHRLAQVEINRVTMHIGKPGIDCLVS